MSNELSSKHPVGNPVVNTPTSATQSFTYFPTLPPEVQELVWRFAANSPRNLDVWAPTTEELCYLRGDGSMKTGTSFEFVTSQPPPGILLACKLSRAIGLQHYELNSGTSMEVDYENKIFANTDLLWRNRDADRICPLRRYSEFAAVEMWKGLVQPCYAMNIYEGLDYFAELVPREDLMFLGNIFPREILLYYSTKYPEPTGRPMDIEFPEIWEDISTPDEWKAVTECKQRIVDKFKNWAELREERLKNELKEDKLTHAENLYPAPVIRYVALVIDGVRY